MHSFTHLVFTLVLLCSIHFSRGSYRTLEHGGFNYTYGGAEERGTYQESLDWCTSLGGDLPSVHSPADIDFMADNLVGTVDSFDSVWLGARRFYDSWKWNDNSPFDFVPGPLFQPPNSDYGLVLTFSPKRDEHKQLQEQPFASMEKRRMVCRLSRPSLTEVHDLRSTVSRLHQGLADHRARQEADINATVSRLVHRLMAGKAGVADKQTQQQEEEEAEETRLPPQIGGLTQQPQPDQSHDTWLILLTVLTAVNSICLLVFATFVFRRQQQTSGIKPTGNLA